MKQAAISLSILILTFSFTVVPVSAKNNLTTDKKGPVVIEVETNHATIEEALADTKSALLNQSFIIQGGMEKSSFTAKRTTGAEADYYIADVSVKRNVDTNTITITFVKIGTGLLKLSKVAEKVKNELSSRS